MSDNGQQVPLIERLRSVPAAARVLEHTPNPLGYDTTSIPVGALCREAAARIAELEADLERMTAARNRDHQQALANGAALAAERERWKTALQAGRDLMAIVHGDGGHYCEAHGDRKAADDAIAIVSKLRSYMDDERARREKAEAVLSWLDMRGGLGYEKHAAINAHFARYEKD